MKLLYFYYKKEHKNVLASPEAQDYAASNVKASSPKNKQYEKGCNLHKSEIAMINAFFDAVPNIIFYRFLQTISIHILCYAVKNSNRAAENALNDIDRRTDEKLCNVFS